MPTYVYECSQCNDQYEVEQRITEDPLETCRCGSKGTVKRLIQPVGVMFKGSGFHINDYSSSATASAEKADTMPEAKSEPAPAAPTADAAATAKE